MRVFSPTVLGQQKQETTTTTTTTSSSSSSSSTTSPSPFQNIWQTVSNPEKKTSMSLPHLFSLLENLSFFNPLVFHIHHLPRILLKSSKNNKNHQNGHLVFINQPPPPCFLKATPTQTKKQGGVFFFKETQWSLMKIIPRNCIHSPEMRMVAVRLTRGPPNLHPRRWSQRVCPWKVTVGPKRKPGSSSNYPFSGANC